MEQVILEMQRITKRFGSLIANDGINFDLRKGEVHALLGENGAGKTTLMNVLFGIYIPEEGEILLNGKPFHVSNPKDAISNGIGMVHQHFMLIPPLTVLQNIVLGQDCSLAKMDMDTPRKKVEQLCQQYNFRVDLDAKVKNISVGAQQRVELIKTLYRGADILILDEPTAVLTPTEVEELFEMLRNFVKQGKSIILISHKLWEVKKLADRVTVLRNGSNIGTANIADVGEKDLAAMMVGKEVSLKYEKTPLLYQQNIVEVQNLYVKGHSLASSLKGICFGVRKGEILAIAGVDGNGQSALAESLMGLVPVQQGKVLFDGMDITKTRTRKRIEKGMVYVPEDRSTQGLIMDFTISENLVLNCFDRSPYTVNGFFNGKRMRMNGTEKVEEFDIRPRQPDSPVRAFSGGNQQKVILAREFSSNPKLVIASQPTRGLDIGASEFVHKKLLQAKAEGVGVLLISADLDEILAVADRVLVINEGKIMGEFIPGEIGYDDIGLMMGGIQQKPTEGEVGA